MREFLQKSNLGRMFVLSAVLLLVTTGCKKHKKNSSDNNDPDDPVDPACVGASCSYDFNNNKNNGLSYHLKDSTEHSDKDDFIPLAYGLSNNFPDFVGTSDDTKNKVIFTIKDINTDKSKPFYIHLLENGIIVNFPKVYTNDHLKITVPHDAIYDVFTYYASKNKAIPIINLLTATNFTHDNRGAALMNIETPQSCSGTYEVATSSFTSFEHDQLDLITFNYDSTQTPVSLSGDCVTPTSVESSAMDYLPLIFSHSGVGYFILNIHRTISDAPADSTALPEQDINVCVGDNAEGDESCDLTFRGKAAITFLNSLKGFENQENDPIVEDEKNL